MDIYILPAFVVMVVLTMQHISNEFTAQELCNEYNGENGIVDVYTNNDKCNISTYGDVSILTLEELESKSKDNISMSRAVSNWIARI